jgi:colanic acid/amylovoran biosynthesis glycosyltransferase
MKPSPRIVMVLHSFPADSPFLWQKFKGLAGKNPNFHMACLEREKPVSSADATEYRNRIHFGWAAGKAAAIFLFPLVLIHVFLKNPKAVLRFAAWRGVPCGLHKFKLFYRDAMLMALNPDILHFEFGALAADRVYLKEILRCRIVVSFRGYDLNYAGLDRPDYYREVWEKADALHLLGEDLWKRAQERGCPSGKKHMLIPPAISLGHFKPRPRLHKAAGTPERPLKILSVGRLVWKKGYEYGLEAVKLLKEQGIRCDYEIAGGGDFLEGIAFARHQLGLDDTVKLAGSKTPAEIEALMQDADVFLHPAVSEGFSNAVIEAQAMQLPVVCTDADGLPENVADGKTGFVVPRRDPKALAEKIRLLCKDPELRKEFGLQGRKRVETLFKIEDQIEAFERLYRSLEA